jgi:hypothetical protein
MNELPEVLDTTGWHWSPFQAPVAISNGFWVGTDKSGQRWLTKLTGAFKAYREIVFGRVAQRMGWSCQSSVFMRVDSDSARKLGVSASSIHAAHWFLNEHVHPPCALSCPLSPLVGKPISRVEDIADLSVANILDWSKGDFAACLFGGNEPPGRLFTAAHEFVIIDSELMFSTRPSSLSDTLWWGEDNTPAASGVAMARQVCADFVGLGRPYLDEALRIPSGVKVDELWPIGPLLEQSFTYAQCFLARPSGP